MNIKQLMKQAQQMQDQMAQRMASIKVEGTAGGGMVKAEMSGNKELLAIKIEKDAVDPNDVLPRPSNSPITPSTTAMSAPAAPWRSNGTIRSSPHSTGSRLRPGRPVASAW